MIQILVIHTELENVKHGLGLGQPKPVLQGHNKMIVLGPIGYSFLVPQGSSQSSID